MVVLLEISHSHAFSVWVKDLPSEVALSHFNDVYTSSYSKAEHYQ